MAKGLGPVRFEGHSKGARICNSGKKCLRDSTIVPRHKLGKE